MMFRQQLIYRVREICTWTSGVNTSGRKITLQGSGIDSTIISLGSIPAIDIGISGSRVTGFEFIFTSSGGKGISAAHTGWRVDHCKFDFRGAGGKGTGVTFSNRNLYYPTYEIGGLVDNCDFYDARNIVAGSAFALHANGTRYHSAPLDLGGSSAVYFEDNYFNLDQFGNLMDANRGGSVIEAHSLQSDNERATKKWEIYGNDITHNSYETMLLRGGTGVAFDNTISGGNNEQIRLNNVRSSLSIGDAGTCDGTRSDWDSNEGTGSSAGWLCRDQIGSGPDSSAFDGTLPLPDQIKQPAYFWNNDSVNPTSDSTHIVQNRDYYYNNLSFDGSSGVGVGMLSNRPPTCIKGVAYWATDDGGDWNKTNGSSNDGCLYKCTDTNTWTKHYTPYTYPHPLREQPLKPQPPQNLKISN